MHDRRPQSRVTRVLAVGSHLLATLTLLVACTTPQLDRRPLYDQLGGERGISLLVDRFLRELLTDEAVFGHFEGIDVRRFRAQLELQLCEISGGPCRYEGESMHDVHRGMDVSQGEFNAVVEDLIRAMESLRLPTPTQNRLLAKLAPMQRDIVVRRPDPPSGMARRQQPTSTP